MASIRPHWAARTPRTGVSRLPLWLGGPGRPDKASHHRWRLRVGLMDAPCYVLADRVSLVPADPHCQRTSLSRARQHAGRNIEYDYRDVDKKVYLKVIYVIFKGSIAQARCSGCEQIGCRVEHAP